MSERPRPWATGLVAGIGPLVLQSLDDAIVVLGPCDASMLITFANPALETLLGYTREESIGWALEDLTGGALSAPSLL